MTEQEFDDQLKAIQHDMHLKVNALVKQAREENADGWLGTQPVDFHYMWSANGERVACAIAEKAGWIIDRMAGINHDAKSTTVKKIRKALGYTYP